jgi:hypothetical protein
MSEFRHPVCLFRWLWRSLRAGGNVSGHDYSEVEHTKKRQVLRCDVCGHESIGVYV